MRHVFVLILCITIASCKKSAPIVHHQEYSVEGYLINRATNLPIRNREIAISQSTKVYSKDDPTVITDTNGHFKFIYTPRGDAKGLNIYPVYNDYSCIYDDISFITNIPKYQNVDLKKIYTSKF